MFHSLDMDREAGLMPAERIENIASVIEYIEAHLAEKLDLETVADAVHYSKYYLHRMFTSTVDMTIHEYAKRRRLTEAAKLLVFTDRPVLDIALIAGYGSQQAFTNIFTAMYKMSPSRFRENEEYYPLQLKFELDGSYPLLERDGAPQWDIRYAAQEDIPCWMELVRLVIDGFPHLHEEEYRDVLCRYIKKRQALILKDGSTAIGIMLFSGQSGSIDFMGTHPLYRRRGIPRAFIRKVMSGPVKGDSLSITTYRAGDKADTGQREELLALGFAEAELLVEFGYPTQRLIFTQRRTATGRMEY